ncbi:hypothetical protein NXS98_08365 [Fontisphaera persica]|uniref:MauE/DoxX family redox-associated membrane protein n=1 Tax=Fontisphaera persica TaxID=2974023 RepID=UPI0024C001D4|nr:MauE/DoxX family redox-associated membrane protein [Fontisphaera persica]WCJ61121.1 hypothetical protein NXS98_08365 [Fontisphaera persica]
MQLEGKGIWKNKIINGFLFSVAVLLLLTASLKLFGSSPDMREGMIPDPVVSFLNNRDVLALAVILEYVTAFYIIFGRNRRMKLAAVLSITLALVWYRIGLYIFGYTTTCYCFGTIAHAFASETPIRHILYAILAYLGIGSAAGLWMDAIERRRKQCTCGHATQFVLCLIIPCLTIQAQEQKPTNIITAYELEGFLRCTFYAGTNVVVTNQLFRYHLWANKYNQWKIRSMITSDIYYEAGCDGTNTYIFFHEPRIDLPAMAAQIYPGCYPYAPYPVTQPWFAFLSAEYVRTNRYLPAQWGVPDPLKHLFEVDVKFMDLPPHLPARARWKVSSHLVKRANEIMSETYPEGMPMAVRAQLGKLSQEVERYKDIEITYVSENVTNINGLCFPLRYCLSMQRLFSHSDMMPSAEKQKSIQKNYKFKIFDFIGVVERLAIVNHIEVLPVLPNMTRIDVSDTRFKNTKYKIFGIQYSITNHWITDARDPRLVALQEARLNEKRKLEFTPMKALFCAGMVCLPMLVLVLLWRQNKQS